MGLYLDTIVYDSQKYHTSADVAIQSGLNEYFKFAKELAYQLAHKDEYFHEGPVLKEARIVFFINKLLQEKECEIQNTH